MKRHHFRITLTLRGPILVHSSSPAAFGVDAAVARVACGPGAGTPCIHGTLLKGKLRESLDQLRRAGVLAGFNLESWFGRDTQVDSGNDPERGCLHLGDLVASTNPASGRRHGIAVDADLGSVRGEMLRVVETPFGAGEEVVFQGAAWVYGGEEKHVCETLRLGLRWLTQIGADRTTGFGRLVNAEIVPVGEPGTPTCLPPAVAALDLTLQPLGPLCVSRHKIGGNLFESEEFVPGNMIAGALLQTANALDPQRARWSNLRGQVDNLVFRHAYPALPTGPRPGVVPYSTAAVDGVCYDVACCKGPHLLKTPAGNWWAPEFPLDWKPQTREEAEKPLGIVHPARELRVRTKIDSASRTADQGDGASGGALFAWEMVHPWTDGSGGSPVVWRGRIELGGITDRKVRDAVAGELAELLPELGYLSKTKAACAVTVTPSAPMEVPDPLPDPMMLLLRTPALIADPRFQGRPGGGAISAADMGRFYRDVFLALSGNSLELSHHFARQFLAGGNHLAFRFQLRRNRRPAYDPWLLTAAGSVFVFRVSDPVKAQAKLREWLCGGLPLPDWARTAFGENWDQNPYLPANGFGEVTIHTSAFAQPQTRPVTVADPILP